MIDLFQTIKNTGNPQQIEKDGPYKCVRNDAWLGEGYYFWDTFVDLAHKWGEVAYNENYIICHSTCNGDLSYVYDLYNPQILNEFREITTKLQTKIASENGKLYMKDIISLIRKKTTFKKYKAIRARFERSLTVERSHINVSKNAYLDTTPAIQWCVIDKKFLSGPYKVIYPQEYCADSYIY